MQETLFKTDLFGGMIIGATLSNFGTPMTLAGSDKGSLFKSIQPNRALTIKSRPTLR